MGGRLTEPRLELSVLGDFRLRRDGERVDVPLGVQRLLAFLALHELPLTRVYVAGRLWPEVPEARAFANLRSALWRVQRLQPRPVRASQLDLSLRSRVAVDLRHATELAHAALAGRTAPFRWAPDWAALTRTLLPGWYDDWLVVERERYRQLSLHALECLAARLTDEEEFGAALDAALAAVTNDPLRESAHRAVIRVHLAEGNHADAVRQYRLFADLMRERLGLAPSPEIHALLAPLRPAAVTRR